MHIKLKINSCFDYPNFIIAIQKINLIYLKQLETKILNRSNYYVKYFITRLVNMYGHYSLVITFSR